MKLLASALTLSLAAGLACAQSHTPDIRRDGTGDRRAALDQLELKPAPGVVYSALSNWAGTPVTAESAKGKAVLLVTFTAWHPVSQQAVLRAEKLAQSFADKGLLVVAVHRADRFEMAGKFVQEKGLSKLSLAQDSGKLREALKCDSDPNFYVIDRAGNMRFADVQSDAVEAALNVVLGESPEAAAKAPELATSASKPKNTEVATRPITETLKAGKSIKIDYTAPNPALYGVAAWPKKNKEDEITATNLQGQPLPNAGTFGLKGIWFTPKPESFEGRVLVLDFWASWCGPCKRAKPMLDDLQRNNRDDLQIVCVTGPDDKQEQKDAERYLREHSYAMSYFFEPDNAMHKAMGVNAIPHTVVVSTDGVIRWQGNPHDPAFRKAVETVISVDPGVQARRKAEQEAMKRGS
jgi:thiol-disulfide isomerase/thioredoxin